METQTVSRPEEELAEIRFMVKHGFLTGDETEFDVYLLRGRIYNEVFKAPAANWPKDWMALPPEELAALKQRVCKS